MLYFFAAATLGLAVNFLSNLIIKLSSATTVKLLAAVRGPLVVLSGMLLFAELVGGWGLFPTIFNCPQVVEGRHE